MSIQSLRNLPSVDQLLQEPQITGWLASYGRPLVVNAIRHTLDKARGDFSTGRPIPNSPMLLEGIAGVLKDWTTPTLIP